MTTTITASTLTVKITESVSLNGKDQGGTNSVSIASIATVNKRIVNIPTGGATIWESHASAISEGTFVYGDVRYLRITNKDDTNYCTLRMTGGGSADICVRLDPGASHVFISSRSEGFDDLIDSAGVDIDAMTAIVAAANSAAVDLEMFTASA